MRGLRGGRVSVGRYASTWTVAQRCPAREGSGVMVLPRNITRNNLVNEVE